MPFVKEFIDLDKTKASTAGGKGASLGEMTQAGIPIPGGFVVLSDSFEHFLKETDLNVEIDAAIDAVNHKEMHTVENASEKIQALILGARMPKAIANDIKKYFKKLNSRFVAVRSSATAEDSSSAAWAGQLESYLNTTEKELLKNVQRCWASLFTPRAIFYRFEKGLHKQKISVAVVVQKMVASEKSGIAFSVHPVTQDYNQLIIEAGLGLGEAIVSGQITPDSYVVEKDPRRIIDKNIATQTRGLFRASKGGNVWREIDDQEGRTQVLSDQQILSLSKIILHIEEHYGFPCDIEWAYEKEKFYIVQSRPITTLVKKENNDVQISKEGWDYWGQWRDVGLFNSPWLSFIDTKTAQALGVVGKMKGESIVLDGNMLCRTTDQEYINKRIQKVLQGKDNFIKRLLKICDQHTSAIKKLEGKKNLEEFIHAMQEAIACSMFVHFVDKSFEPILHQECQSSKISYADVLASIHPIRPTLLMQYQRDVKKLTKKNAKKFLSKYCWVGMHGFRGKQLTEKRAFLDHKEMLRKKNNRVLKIKFKPKLQVLVDIGSELVFHRSNLVETISKVGLSYTSQLKKLATKYNTTFTNILNCGHFELLKLLRGADLPKNLTNRKQRFGFFYNGNSWKVFIGKELKRKIEKIVPVASFTEGAVIQGQVAFRGLVRGKVSIAITAEEASKVRDGDILVAPETTPDYIIAMRKAAAFVTNHGGITSHASIVAREMGKPCIIGTKNATQILKDGDFVEVDANTGVVRKISASLKTTFVKQYTRDYSLILEQAWAHGLTMGVQKAFGWKDLPANSSVFFMNAGAIEVWENPEFFSALREKLRSEIERKPKWLEQTISRYNQYLQKFKKLVASKPASTKTALTSLVTLVYESMPWFIAFYYAGQDDQIPKAIRAKAEKVRLADVSFDLLDSLLRKSIATTLPKVRGFENVLLTQEIDAKVPAKQVLLQRQQQFVLAPGYAKTARLENYAEQSGIVFKKVMLPGNDQLRGEIGFKGKTTGVVRIIRRKDQIVSFKPGEILVSPMTTPEYMHAMQSAAAIVTDEGGALCHAAIIARELKRPCVIGTKIATEVLQDGDLVEVDAVIGVVKILKKTIQNQESIKKQYIFMWSMTPSTPACWATSDALMHRHDIFPDADNFYYYDGKIMTSYMRKEQLDEFKNKYSPLFLKQKHFFEYQRKYKREAKNWWQWIRRIEKKNYLRVKSKDIAQDHKQMTQYLRDAIAYFGSTRPEFTYAPEQELERILERRFGSLWPQKFAILTSSREMDEIQKEHFSWLKLLERTTKDAALLQHVSLFSWLVFGLFEEKDVLAFLRHRIKEQHLKDAEEFIKYKKQKAKLRVEQNKIFAQLKINSTKARYLSSYLQTQSVERMNIKAFWAGSFYLGRNFWKSVAHILHIDLQEIMSYVAPTEIQSLLSGSISKVEMTSLIKQRKRYYAFDHKQGVETKILSGEEAKNAFNKHIKPTLNKTDNITGQAASLGVYKGRVRKVIAGDVAMLRKDIAKFKKGEILVTSMTQPNMMILAKRAGAIVADEGGITSHAAIIARELNIPCIVGCLQAMQSLKDGDFVEVDANKGIARKLMK